MLVLDFTDRIRQNLVIKYLNICFLSAFLYCLLFALLLWLLVAVSKAAPNQSSLLFCMVSSGAATLAPSVVGSHQMVPHWAASVVPVELCVVNVVVHTSLILPIAVAPVTLQRENQKAKTEKPEDPERDDGGDDDGGGEVDGGLRPVHREAGERVRVERLMVLLVHPLVKPGCV